MAASATLSASWQLSAALQTNSRERARARVGKAQPNKLRNEPASLLRSSFVAPPLSLVRTISIASTTRKSPPTVQALDQKVTDKMWPELFRELVVKVSSVSVDDLKNMQAKREKITILDVRPPEEFKEYNIAGSINVPLYKQIVGWSPIKIVRRLAFAFFGIFNGTELNEQFMAEVNAAIPNKSDAILLCCGTGGTLRRTDTSPNGRTSRSLLAAELALNDGYKKLLHLDGGVSAYSKADETAVDDSS